MPISSTLSHSQLVAEFQKNSRRPVTNKTKALELHVLEVVKRGYLKNGEYRFIYSIDAVQGLEPRRLVAYSDNWELASLAGVERSTQVRVQDAYLGAAGKITIQAGTAVSIQGRAPIDNDSIQTVCIAYAQSKPGLFMVEGSYVETITLNTAKPVVVCCKRCRLEIDTKDAEVPCPACKEKDKILTPKGNIFISNRADQRLRANLTLQALAELGGCSELEAAAMLIKVDLGKEIEDLRVLNALTLFKSIVYSEPSLSGESTFYLSQLIKVKKVEEDPKRQKVEPAQPTEGVTKAGGKPETRSSSSKEH